MTLPNYLTLARILMVPILVVVLLTYWFTIHTRIGRQVYALGSNPVAAPLRGISVTAVTLTVFAISGALAGLAGIYQELIRRYDLLYKMSFPYVMAVYQAPVDGGYSDYHLHLVFLPPLRQPGIKKHPAGPEIGGGNFMADTMPEDKASELRAIDVSLFKKVF